MTQRVYAASYEASVIIPTLDQFRYLDATLEAVRTLSFCPEILLVDGGSGDDTIALARAKGVRVIMSRAVRGRQLNIAAAQTHGSVLLFLEAGATPTTANIQQMHEALSDRHVVGGSFRGRSGLFVWRNAFEMVHGFRPYPAFEDIDLLHRLRPLGRVLRLPYVIPSLSHRRRHFLLRPLYQLGLPPDFLSRYIDPEREVVGPRYPALRLSTGS